MTQYQQSYFLPSLKFAKPTAMSQKAAAVIMPDSNNTNEEKPNDEGQDSYSPPSDLGYVVLSDPIQLSRDLVKSLSQNGSGQDLQIPKLIRSGAEQRMLTQDNYITLVPASASTVVNQTDQYMYHIPGDQALRIIKDTRLRRIQWVEIFSHRNQTNSPETRQVEMTTQLTITNGQEVNTELGVTASFRGLGLNFGMGQRTFQTTETTQTQRITNTYTIPPGESLYLYQRVYVFEETFWWILDAWNAFWTVGVPGGYSTLTSSTQVSIQADETMSRTTPPINQNLAVDVSAFPNQVRPHHNLIRKHENITQRAKNSIADIRRRIDRA